MFAIERTGVQDKRARKGRMGNRALTQITRICVVDSVEFQGLHSSQLPPTGDHIPNAFVLDGKALVDAQPADAVESASWDDMGPEEGPHSRASR